MQLRSFTAPTLSEAMAQVRDELGADAIIISTLNNGAAGARIIVAVDGDPTEARGELATMAPTPAAPRLDTPAASPPPSFVQPVPATADDKPEWRRVKPAPWITAADKFRPPAPPAAPAPAPAPPAAAPAAPAIATAAPRQPTTAPAGPVAIALASHGVPRAIIARLLTNAPASVDALVARLGVVFKFASLFARSSRSPILLAGPPGSGKTLTVAKLAARAVMTGGQAHVITTDTLNAGGIERLATFARAMRVPVDVADRPSDVVRLLDAMKPDAQIIIDTPATNPFLPADLARIGEIVAATGADACLTLPVGLDPAESGEIAAAFGTIGCTRLIATRVDAARRLGSILAAAVAGPLSLAEAGVAPLAADGLVVLSPRFLAERLMASYPARETPGDTRARAG